MNANIGTLACPPVYQFNNIHLLLVSCRLSTHSFWFLLHIPVYKHPIYTLAQQQRQHFCLGRFWCGHWLELKTHWSKLIEHAVFFLTEEQNVEAIDSMEFLPPEEPATTMHFTYHSNAQMISILKKTEEQCSDIARTYSIGRSMEGRELLVIEFSNNPGQHELRK